MDRRIVTGGLVLVAGSLLAAALLAPVGAHGTNHVDATSAEPAIHGHNPGQGIGVEGPAPAGRGVVGTGGVGVSGDGRVGVSGRGMTGVSGRVLWACRGAAMSAPEASGSPRPARMGP